MNHERILKSHPAKALPTDIGVIHLVGIGGIGMSGIAEILHNLGYKVAGSDVAENNNIQRLRNLGINVAIGHDAKNIENVACVVKSTAVPFTNPEIIAAKEARIPVVRRSEMLAELTRLKATIAIAGSHGKTTTTSLVAQLLTGADFDPTVINGGIINAYGTNAKVGRSDWLVAEADESDGTFIKIPATVGVVTNIDPEHLDHWGTFDNLKAAFRTFIENLPFYGFAVVCIDDPEVRSIAEGITGRRLLTYGIESADADLIPCNIEYDVNGSKFDVKLSSHISEKESVFKGMVLPLAGQHNVLNATAVIAVGLELGISHEIIRASLAGFDGVKRRFTKTGEVNGITVIDDYGHHPVEIAATLSAAKQVQSHRGGGKVVAVVQPHRYSRLNNLFAEFAGCFADADEVIVTEVYAAGEKPIEGVSRDSLVAELKRKGKSVHALGGAAELAGLVNSIAKSGDMVVCLGAGNVTQWAYALPEQLAAIAGNKNAGAA